MALTYSIHQEFGREASDFQLPGVDGRTYSLSDFQDRKALIVMFMCNHCPYVIAVQERINALAKDFGPRGVTLIGINSNDAVNYPDDSFEKMRTRAETLGYVFPYLFDETQEVARAYDAACTPDPYVFENVGGKFLLRYHGRIDDSWKDSRAVKKRDLAEAVEAILAGRAVSMEQVPSMGCSIKWKAVRSSSRTESHQT